MEELKVIWEKYKGAVIGIAIAVILMVLRLESLIIGIILIVVAGFIGNYVQHNKDLVKSKLKKYIDKM